MNTIIPAADVGQVIYDELAQFAQANYGDDGQKLLAEFLEILSFELGV